jgi:prepilin-type N-terminal cleavage/methylation domain-containing protein
MMKYLKNNKGFTLVEVIVVAVIVLVLAAVAIPLYNGYVRDSRQAAAENIAGSIAALAGAVTQTGATGLAQAGSGVNLTIAAVGGQFGDDAQVLVPRGFQAVVGQGIVTVTASPQTTPPTEATAVFGANNNPLSVTVNNPRN